MDDKTIKIESQIGKTHFTYDEIVKLYEKEPPPKELWNGIAQESFGLIFGPSKSGKTTYCEILAQKFTIGASDFLGYKMIGVPQKVLFISLEENWKFRVRRNKKQFEELTSEQQLLYSINYMYEPLDYLRLVSKPSDWVKLKNTILNSKAQIVFIDSVTRLNHGSLEKSADAEKIALNLRKLSDELKITLICIHHTPKIGNKPLELDSIKGSSVFAQEADFMIGIRRAPNGKRYSKNVAFRYFETDDSKIREFQFSEGLGINYLGTSYELSILEATDRRRNNDDRNIIISEINKLKCNPIKTKRLIANLTEILELKERQIKSLLKDLVENKKIKQPKRGMYTSIDCNNIKIVGDEEE